MKCENETSIGIFDLSKAVKAAGGWDGYYQLEYQESLTHSKNELKEFGSTPLTDDDPNFKDWKQCQHRVEQYETLFQLHHALVSSGYHPKCLFMWLAHTLDYYESVLVPMKALVEQGEVQEAYDLLSQPRRYHR